VGIIFIRTADVVSSSPAAPAAAASWRRRDQWNLCWAASSSAGGYGRRVDY